jgi:dTDP-4-dehydrorhamnose reductase
LNILVTGGQGEFVKQLVKHNSEHQILNPNKSELDVRSYWDSDAYFYRYQKSFDYVIHAGAITRPMVIHEDNPTLSIKTNIIGTANMVLMCERYNKKIIYLSTDYVYSGKDGNYKETDTMKPFTKYGWSKLGGECAVQMYDNHLILRLAMNKKPFPHPKALTDMRKSLIYIDDAAKITLKLLDETGIINVGGKSQSVYEFVKETNPDIEPITLSDVSDVNMATDCTMDTTKMEEILDDSVI